MKTKFTSLLTAGMILVASKSAQAQGTSFTYQGRLTSGTNTANGIYDLQFTVYNNSSGGSVFGGPLTNSAVAISNGLFSVMLDFGSSVFPGSLRWLEIGVRSNGLGAFTTVLPRQQITAAPYAILAGNISGTVASSSFSGTYANPVTLNNAANSFTGNGGGLTNVNAGALGGFSANQLWRTTGNSNTVAGVNFLGTTDNQPLDFRVNNTRVLRLERTLGGNGPAPNVIGGYFLNAVSNGVIGATIAGGGGSEGIDHNLVTDDYGAIGGGTGNEAGNRDMNFADAAMITIGGGLNNRARAGSAVIGGGRRNLVESGANDATVSGGFLNAILTNAPLAVIGGGNANTIEQNATNAIISGGSFNRILTNANHATIAGGNANRIGDHARYAVIGGGSNNTNTTPYSTIGGGSENRTGGDYATVSGGRQNRAPGDNAMVPGGANNSAQGNWSLAAGRRATAREDGSFVWADSQDADFASTASDQFIIRARGGIGIGATNPAGAVHILAPTSAPPSSLASQDNGLLFGLQGTSGYKWIQSYGGALVVNPQGNPVGIGLNNPTNTLHVAGGVSATAFVNTSDRNAKENFKSVDTREVLAKVAALPITRWNYKVANDGAHIGPTAQDFYAAFGLGGSDQTITTVDPDGVALAAIQGLNQKVEQKEAEITELKTRLAKLERLINAMHRCAK